MIPRSVKQQQQQKQFIECISLTYRSFARSFIFYLEHEGDIIRIFSACRRRDGSRVFTLVGVKHRDLQTLRHRSLRSIYIYIYQGGLFAHGEHPAGVILSPNRGTYSSSSQITINSFRFFFFLAGCFLSPGAPAYRGKAFF